MTGLKLPCDLPDVETPPMADPAVVEEEEEGDGRKRPRAHGMEGPRASLYLCKCALPTCKHATDGQYVCSTGAVAVAVAVSIKAVPSVPPPLDYPNHTTVTFTSRIYDSVATSDNPTSHHREKTGNAHPAAY